MTPEPGRTCALLVVSGRPELAFHELHGEPLYSHALRALVEAAGPTLVAVGQPDVRRVRTEVERWRLPADVLSLADCWGSFRETPASGLLVHDSLCPLATSDFLAAMAQRAADQPAVSFVAVRAVTDTLKSVVDGLIQGTVDRDGLATVTSPLMIPAEVLDDAGAELPPLEDFVAMIAWLRDRGEVQLVPAPSLARRVEHSRSVQLMECLDEVGHRVRAEAGSVSSVANHGS